MYIHVYENYYSKGSIAFCTVCTVLSYRYGMVYRLKFLAYSKCHNRWILSQIFRLEYLVRQRQFIACLINHFSARTRQGRVQNDVAKMRMGNSRLPAISTNCIAIYINSTEQLVVCMHFNIVCMHYGEQFASILPIWGEFRIFGGWYFIFLDKKCCNYENNGCFL
jgi:hypothetical protein